MRIPRKCPSLKGVRAPSRLETDRGMVFDSSRLNEPPRLMLLFAAGRLVQAEPTLPDWILPGYAEDLMG